MDFSTRGNRIKRATHRKAQKVGENATRKQSKKHAEEATARRKREEEKLGPQDKGNRKRGTGHKVSRRKVRKIFCQGTILPNAKE